MYKVGLSSCSKAINEDLFKQYHDAGIKFMEVSHSTPVLEALDFKEIKTYADRYGVELWSFHLPFSPFERLDISKRSLKRNAVEYQTEFIKKASDIGIDRFIIHPSGEPIDDCERGQRMECAKEALAELVQIAEQNGAVIVVENLPRTCLGRSSDEILELISVHDSLRVCFDTNHLFDEEPADFVRKVGKRIITTHISDYDFLNERHWLPGEGKLSWQPILKALEDIGYSGIWLYELGFKAPESIIRQCELTCADFVRNAKEVFENREITVFGKPVDNLKGWR